MGLIYCILAIAGVIIGIIYPLVRQDIGNDEKIIWFIGAAVVMLFAIMPKGKYKRWY